MADNIHLDDVGTIFKLTIKNPDNVVVDVSSATIQELIFAKPDGTSLTKSSFTGDGTDGQIQYTTVSGDLNEVGLWHIQGHVVLSSGNWRSSIEHFDVFPNL